MDESKEAGSEFVITNGDSAELFEFEEEIRTYVLFWQLLTRNSKAYTMKSYAKLPYADTICCNLVATLFDQKDYVAFFIDKFA